MFVGAIQPALRDPDGQDLAVFRQVRDQVRAWVERLRAILVNDGT
ncbi:hypothetical protein [Candidatus Cyanaurora vandensis]|nr:hypothetical protein [Candidatus Cyanaurora vandensis]